MPGSGGSFRYLVEGFGSARLGRLIGFLFIWQFILSGPLEIASGYIGFANYAGYLWTGLTKSGAFAIAALVGIVNIVLLYRRIHSIATITLSLWVGSLVAVAVVIATGALHFDPHRAFDFPPQAFRFSKQFLFGLGAASAIGIYDYLGYYNICYIGDEVKDPGRVIPRSILVSTIAVALIYVAVNFSVIGVVPWREFVPAQDKPAATFIVSIFMQQIYGPTVAAWFTLLILWTAFASVFALLLGYSRIPYAAARDGYFFKSFARLHPTGQFPSVSLVVLGIIAIACSALSLGAVIGALLVTRIVVQFIGQIAAVVLLRRNRPDLPRPYRIWLYPLPLGIALVGWLFVFATTERPILLFGLGMLALGVAGFALWSWRSRTWPFAQAPR
jgi:basic amino acid/polyamine antiporter, APA family